ncbi:unnamed protein product [Jaminaea pallidilutea]
MASMNAAASTSSSSSSSSTPQFDSIDSAIASIRNNEFVVVLDSEDRENEGDLIIAAQSVTTEQMAWLIRHSSGFVCIALSPQRIQELELPMMFPKNEDPKKTAYTVTVDYKHGTTTGISAHDRALTARMLAAAHDSQAGQKDFSRPGHLCPLRYTEGGVRVRMGHTEASVDLAVAAGLPPMALLCELVDPDSPQGAIASRDACFKFARAHGLKVITIEALKRWREEQDGPLARSVVEKAARDSERGIELDEQRVVGPSQE